MFEPCCKKTNYKMSKTQNVILRVTIVLAMIVAVVAVLYFSPLPEGHFESCDRPCHDLDWPMICRMKIHIEAVQTIRSCEDCALNQTPSQDIIVNRQSPGPPIQICQNDILVVDVVNKIPGHTLTVHWRGQPNNEAPYMDGVPLVTQCPIVSYTTFQYKFRATAPGTHVYQAFSDDDRSRGTFGALIIRQSEKNDPLRKHYDVDSKKHVILISEGDDALLINGKAPSDTGAAVEVFTLKRNKRYRFRAAFVGGDGSCPVSLTIDNHPIRIIALDGNPVSPNEATAVVLGKGERVDFVLKSGQGASGYFLRVKSCRGEGLALLSYEDGGKGPESLGAEKDGRSLDTALCESRIGRVCLSDMKGLQRMPEKLRHRDKVVYLSFGSRIVNVNGKFSSRVYGVNNLTFTYPSSPLLTQLDQVSLSTICDELNVPEKCQGKEICECIHVEYIPLGASTEIILINQDETDHEHVFHLHGYRFHLVGFRQFDSAPSTEEMKFLDKKNALFKRNFNNPVVKDTVRVPKNGVVALRFLANNPGFWMLRDEKSKGWTRGMDIVFQVGDSSDLPSTPSDFPTCGNYIGPDFFLM
ncbi:uncharacterized protein LOC135141166 isoform X2 [Zophobas morio]